MELFRSQNKTGQNTFKNTPEDNLDTFCDIISHITTFWGPRKLPDLTITDFDKHYSKIN